MLLYFKNRTTELLRDKVLVFVMLPLLPVAASIVQVAVPSFWITLPIVAVAELVLYMYLQKLSIKNDPLTGIYNRGSFDTYISDKLQFEDKRKMLCLYLIDLDYFKQINDTFGHDVGDSALIKASIILNNYVHEKKAFLARYGGDEFCIVMYCKNRDIAENVCADIKQAFNNSNLDMTEKYRLSCSIGYCFLENGENIAPNQMIKIADAMLYENKKLRNSK